MMFPDKLNSIKSTDHVLEVGPGGTPHERSDVLLEKDFDETEAKKQRGNTPSLQINKKTVYYSGGRFPFSDNEFDYVICSHVLEHIEEDEFDTFISELQRVANKGYIEFPTFYYEHLYNFDVHVTIPFYKDGTLYYMSKEKSGISKYRLAHEFFYDTLEKGHTSLVDCMKNYFFQGFEWRNKISIKKTEKLTDLLFTKIDFSPIPIHTKNKRKNIFKKIRRKLKKWPIN